MSPSLPIIPASATRFSTEFMRAHAPVVIRGLFDGTALGAIRSARAASERLGDSVVHVKPNVVERYVGAVHPAEAFSWSRIRVRTSRTTVAEYIAEVSRNPADGRIASEQPAPHAVIDAIAGDDFLPSIDAGLPVARKDPPRDATAALVFLANRGNASDTHTDFDGRHVISYQLFGRKKFVLFPPQAAPKLTPIEIFSMVRIRGMSPTTLAAFLEYAGGVEVVLEPGDAIYMPPFYYHHVEYLDLAMGLTLRFTPPDRRTEACMFRCHRDMWLQNVWCRILRAPESPEALEALDTFERTLARRFASRIEKYRAVRGLAKETCERWRVFGDDPTEGWLSSADFLEHLLSMRYAVGVRAGGDSISGVLRRIVDELRSPNERRDALWRSKEQARFAVEIVMRRMLARISHA